MKFNDFLNQAWNDHAKDSVKVAERLFEGMSLVEKNEEIPQLAYLMTHVFGEHLGKWNEGFIILQKLTQLSCFEKDSESDKSVVRMIASLELASGKRDSVREFSSSDQIRILTVAASAVGEQKQSEKARTLFQEALKIAETNLLSNDPANRSLAVTGNSLASALEEKAYRSADETELMILAAKAARKYWEIAGTWLEVERAEYRLAMTYLAAEDLMKALEHAQNCLEIIDKNNAAALEYFFGYEALARIEKKRNNMLGFSKAIEQAQIYFSDLGDDKSWCEESLKKLLE